MSERYRRPFRFPPQFSLPDSGAEEARETVEVEAVEAREARAVAEKKATERDPQGSGVDPDPDPFF